jgi:hypothetical protein
MQRSEGFSFVKTGVSREGEVLPSRCVYLLCGSAFVPQKTRQEIIHGIAVNAGSESTPENRDVR